MSDLQQTAQATFELAGKKYTSRLLLGTGKCRDLDETRFASV